MVQFLSINFFFLNFLNFCWVFQKFPFFCVALFKKETRNAASISLLIAFNDVGKVQSVF